jgi:cysteinyl-tRNA synthetase
MKYLGTTFDIHSGGEDLIFPHHENEIAQSEAATGKRFVRFWLHSGMLLVGGRKMAKSSGNFFTLRDLLSKGHDPLAVRYLLMSAQYRAQLNFTEGVLADAEKAVQAIRGTYRRINNIGRTRRHSNAQLLEILSRERREFEKAMDDDLNTPGALAAIHRAARVVNRAIDQDEVSTKDTVAIHQFFSDLDRVVGILGGQIKADELPEEAGRLIRERDQARANRDWATADSLRKQLLAMGIVVEDTPAGTVWKRKSP